MATATYTPTATERRVYDYIRKSIKAGAAPSYTDIADFLKLSGASTAYQAVAVLSAAGYLAVTPGKARSIRLTRKVLRKETKPARSAKRKAS